MLAGKFGNAALPNEFEFLRVWGNPKLSLGSRTAAFVRHIFERLLLEYSVTGPENLDIIQPYLITLLV